MPCSKFSRISVFIAGLVPISFLGFPLPSKAASALAAWSLDSNGVLQLRTSVKAKLKAYFQSHDEIKGQRVWIDFPGELIRPRNLPGNGPVKQIRLGKPSAGKTRLVIELNKGIFLNPTNLQLVGVSPDRWKLNLIGLPTDELNKIGEGDITAYSSRSWLNKQNGTSIRTPINASSLPNLPRGKFFVVIDPGHGGPDSGAIGIKGIKETNVVLDVSLQVAKLLERKGIKVKMTRTSEIDLDLPPRVAMANRLRADAFISIHANASRNLKRNVNGIETFYFAGARGFRLSKNIQSQVLNVSNGSPDRGVRRGRFFVIRRTNMPAALVEIGFLTGRLDGPRLAKAEHRRNLALAIAKGIINYLKGAS